MSKSSASSLSVASSPNPRESFDLYGPKLGKVAEEQEREDIAPAHDIARSPSISNDYSLYFASEAQDLPITSTYQPGHTFEDRGAYSNASLEQYHSKRPRSSENVGPSLHRRLSRRIGSMSRRLKNRSGTGPQLSVMTHVSAPPSRAGSTTSAQIISPAMSAISQHESYLPPSPAYDNMEHSRRSSYSHIDEEMEDRTPEELPQAATPLLPPVLSEHFGPDDTVNSPLQSPSIAPTPAVLSSRTSLDSSPVAHIAGLPSPPLSTKPSMVSIHQRSRANTTTAALPEIPPLQLGHEDPWSHALGHANFNIRPEPYLPQVFDLESYTEFRSNWDVARSNYAKHLVRTSEHYGSTSKVFKLTVEKWTSIERCWKAYHDAQEKIVGPQLQELKRASDEAPLDSQPPKWPLEKPLSRIVMPEIDDKCGKFPELGDSDIVGPMEVAPPRSAEMSPSQYPLSPRKRSLLRFLSDMFGKA